MRRIEILIVEDDYNELENLKDYCESVDYIAHIGKNKEDAMAIFKRKSIDIAIIDIYLHGRPEGLEIAEFVSKSGKKRCPILFLTNSQDRVIFDKAKLSAPSGFLIKPYNPLELNYAIELAVERALEENHNFDLQGDSGAGYINEKFLFKKQERLVKVIASEIIYIQVEGRYCQVITNQEKFLVQSSLTNLLKILNPQTFARTHRNYAVNINHVKEVLSSDNLVVMNNDESIFISSRIKEDFLNHYKLLK